MRLLFNQVAVEEYQASLSDLFGIVQRKQQDRMTGLITCFYLSGSQLILILSRGKIVNAYLHDEKYVEKLEVDNWTAVEQLGTGVVQVRPLPPEMVRLSKLLIEQTDTGRVAGVETSQIYSFLKHWNEELETSIVHLRWASGEGIVVLSGNGRVFQDSMVVTVEKVYGNTDFLIGLNRWVGQPCVITHFNGETKLSAWQEYYLHAGFVDLTEKLLAHYEKFTGKILVNSIARDIHVTAEKMGWSVSLENGRISDQTIFALPEEAASAYRSLLAAIFHHMTVVIGARLVQTIVSDVTDNIDSHLLKNIRFYSLIPVALLPYVHSLEASDD
jgi:hypothetical protein